MYHLSNAQENNFQGNYYTIICKKDQKALQIGKSSSYDFEGSSIISDYIDPQNNLQLFLIDKLDNYPGQYQIVSCPTDYVLQEKNRQIILANGKQSKYQRFRFKLVQGNKYNLHKYYSIIPVHNPDCALVLQGTLRSVTLDPNSVGQHFRFQIANNYTIQNSCIITNHLSRKVIDVPKSSDKHGERVTIYERNNRWNQRWYFQRVGEKSWLILSLVNNLCLDISGASRDSGAKVVQWPQNGGTNQMWYLQQVNHQIYKIRSCHQSSLCLAVRNQQTSDGGYLEVTSSDNATSYWMIQGTFPKN